MSEISRLIDDFLADEFETSPTLASSLGLTAYDSRLDDLSASAFERRDAAAATWLDRFAGVPDDALDPDERTDRDLAMSVLRGRLILADWQNWRREPLTYSTPLVNGIFNLFLHRLRPESELAEAALARLAETPRALEQGRSNLDPLLAHPVIVERAIGSARGGIRYLRELLPAEIEATGPRRRLEQAGAAAAEALEDWVRFLEGLRGAATGSWQLGEQRYTDLLRERESLTFDARSLRAMGQAEYDRLDGEMRELAQRISGSDDWRALIEEANNDHPPTEERMRQGYADWTGRARDFVIRTGLVTLPAGERCSVEPSPVFQRPILGVASYVAPAMFADTVLGHFFVPFAPDGTPPEEVQKRLAANSYGGIPTTAVHEAYPGHHWHLTMNKVHSRRLRKVFGTPYFSEGWALYAERVMRERGFFTEPLHELYHLEATIFRAARIVVDTSLHLGEMTFDEAVTFMTTKVPLPEPTARAEVGRYCAWPTQASAYLTGCLEILRMRDRYLAARGAGDTPPARVDVRLLRAFHDTLASSGRMPLGLAERALMARVEAGADMQLQGFSR
ncbi:MAG: DUF885 domain-containing protein [Chloroflexota bacterium]|nr:DUF885 domain-containing protein [Chloroflexota bacterium]